MNADEIVRTARELCEKATPGPWRRHDTADYAEIHNGDTWGKDLSPIALVGHTDDANFIARSRTLIPELCDALEKAEEQIERVHKALDFAETQRQRSKNYTELAINNGLALGRIAVILQHDFEPLPAPPEEGGTT